MSEPKTVEPGHFALTCDCKGLAHLATCPNSPRYDAPTPAPLKDGEHPLWKQLVDLGATVPASEWKRVQDPEREAESLRDQLKQAQERKDAAYEERNRVVAAIASCFPSGIRRTNIEGWSNDWHGCVLIDSPVGQLSWHYHDSQAHLFAHLPPYTKPWDGHTTEEKYARLTTLRPQQSAEVARLREAGRDVLGFFNPNECDCAGAQNPCALCRLRAALADPGTDR